LIKLHDVTESTGWSHHVYKTESVSGPGADYANCATLCLFVELTCQIFAYEPVDQVCHFGYFAKTDGTLTTTVNSWHLYINEGRFLFETNYFFVQSCPLFSSHSGADC
jgi:hypothetical protein